MVFGDFDATTGNLVDLAQYQFWGVMIAVMFIMPVMLWMIVKTHSRATERLIDRMTIPVDGMRHSVDQLAQQLAANTASVDSMLRNISAKVDIVSEDVDDLQKEVHAVTGTVKKHGEILDEHSEQLAAKKTTKRRGK